MKKVIVNFTVLILLLAACSPQAQPTDLPSEVEEPATQISEDLTAAETAAISALSQNLGLAADEIGVISTEPVEWPDSCLGISMEGTACAQAITPGFRVVLEANGKQVEYHTNEDGTVVLPATVALTWHRSGGIAGFCDNLTIYLSGEVQGSKCNASEVVEKSLVDLLSPEEIATMNEWISNYDVIEIDASDPKGVADGMTVKLQFFGMGTEKLSSATGEQVLLEFAQNLYQEVKDQ